MIKDLWVFVRKNKGKQETIAILNIDNQPTPMIYHDKAQMKEAQRTVKGLPTSVKENLYVRHFKYVKESRLG